MKKKIAILGSTGSIGKTTFNIIKKNKNEFEVVLLTTNKNINEISKFYIPCKAKYLNDLNEKKCITILRQFLKVHNHTLMYKEKYVKGKKIEKYNSDLIDFLATYFEISKDEVKSYMILFKKPEIIHILKKYGYNDKEIKKMTK